MNQTVTLKVVLVILFALQHFTLKAEEVPFAKTVHVATAGTLSDLIDEADKYAITDLTVSGDLNGDDISYIRAMLGIDPNFLGTPGVLTTLNLEDANIVKGGGAYSGSYYTKNNVIGKSMFSDRKKLLSIRLPKTITIIEDYAFYECESITKIDIPEGVTQIGDYAFRSCYNLTTVTMGDNVASLGRSVFSYCNNLTSINLSNSITIIDSNTFHYCHNLSSIHLPEKLTSIYPMAFEYCYALKTIEFPSGVTSISSDAFRGCRGLVEVTFPSQLKKIEQTAFDGCYSLENIYCKNPTPPTIYDRTFYEVKKDKCKLHIPNGSSQAYETDYYWGEFQQIIEKEVDGVEDITSNPIQITPSKNSLTIETNQIIHFAIYNLSGVCIYEDQTNSSLEIPLETGIYIVKAGKENYKVRVE